MTARALRLVGSLLIIALGARSSSAAPGPQRDRVKKAVEPEPTPAPQVTLEVTPGAGGAPWRLQVTNKESTPVRLVADPRLLILELTPPAPAEPPKKPARPGRALEVKGLRCELPSELRPASDADHDLVVPPSRSWSTTFDPIFYCFGARERAALVPGTTVKARYGWSPGKGKPSAPFVVTLTDAAAKLAPAKEIASETFSLKDAVVGEDPAKKATDASAPALSTPPSVDVARGAEVGTDITFTNPTDRALTLLFRANMFEFTVVGPHGGATCGEPRSVATPIRELLTTVPAKGSTHTSVLVSSVCPAGTFDDAGIYRVIPRLDTRSASGRSMGIRTWDGVAVGKAPLLIRVRSPRSPELHKPTLD